MDPCLMYTQAMPKLLWSPMGAEITTRMSRGHPPESLHYAHTITRARTPTATALAHTIVITCTFGVSASAQRHMQSVLDNDHACTRMMRKPKLCVSCASTATSCAISRHATWIHCRMDGVPSVHQPPKHNNGMHSTKAARTTASIGTTKPSRRRQRLTGTQTKESEATSRRTAGNR